MANVRKLLPAGFRFGEQVVDFVGESGVSIDAGVVTADLDFLNAELNFSEKEHTHSFGELTGNIDEQITAGDNLEWDGSTLNATQPGGFGQADGYGELDDSKVTDIESEADGRYLYLVDPDGDNRTDQSTPAGIDGDMGGHLIAYDSDTTEWYDYGAVTGMALKSHGNEVHLDTYTIARSGARNQFVQSTTPTARKEGDIWIETD